MAKQVYLAEDAAPKASDLDRGSSKARHHDASAGTFALRRTRYFNEAAQEPLSGTALQKVPASSTKKKVS